MTQDTSTPIERVLGRLEGVKARQTGYVALCPSHPDRSPSLSIKEGDDGRALLHCFAGCSIEEVCGAIGIETKELFPDNHIPVSVGAKHTEFYVYKDEQGNPLYQIKRTPNKEFYPYVYDKEREEYKRKAGYFGQERVPYRLDEIAASEDEVVYWCEGERDTDKLASLELTATTSPGGTNGFDVTLANYLKGREVIIVPDNDEPGKAYGQRVAEALRWSAKKVRMLHLPGLPEKGDVSDFFDSVGGTKAAFLEYAQNAPEYSGTDEWTSPETESTPLQLLSMGTTQEIPAQEYIVEGLIPAGHASMTYGDGGVGKSILCLSMACALAEGLPDWLGFAIKQTNVVYLDYEMPFEEQVRRARKVARGLGLEKVPDNLFYLGGSPENSWEAIKEVCLSYEIGLVIVDSFGLALAGDMEASNDIIAFIRDFVKPLLSHDMGVHFIDHQPKAQGNNYQDMTAFGSVYKRNLVRSQIQVEGRHNEDHPGTYQVIFRHKKHNFGPMLPPFGAELVFDDEEIRLRSTNLEVETLMQEKGLKVDDRVLLALYDESGALTRSDVSERIGATAGTVANALTTLRKKDLVTESDLKQGRQAMYELMMKGVRRVEMDLMSVPSENGWKDGGMGFVE